MDLAINTATTFLTLLFFAPLFAFRNCPVDGSLTSCQFSSLYISSSAFRCMYYISLYLRHVIVSQNTTDDVNPSNICRSSLSTLCCQGQAPTKLIHQTLSLGYLSAEMRGVSVGLCLNALYVRRMALIYATGTGPARECTWQCATTPCCANLRAAMRANLLATQKCAQQCVLERSALKCTARSRAAHCLAQKCAL
eukprot:Gb_26542 [translate_table: standard]